MINEHSAKTFIKQQNINCEAPQEFKQMLSLVDWNFCHQTTGCQYSIQPALGILFWTL